MNSLTKQILNNVEEMNDQWYDPIEVGIKYKMGKCSR